MVAYQANNNHHDIQDNKYHIPQTFLVNYIKSCPCPSKSWRTRYVSFHETNKEEYANNSIHSHQHHHSTMHFAQVRLMCQLIAVSVPSHAAFLSRVETGCSQIYYYINIIAYPVWAKSNCCVYWMDIGYFSIIITH